MNRPKIHPNITQTSNKNRPVMDQKSSLRLLAADPEKRGWRSIVWDPLGAVLAASWAVLAASWARLGGLGGFLSPSWARLGGRNRTPSRPNIDPKIDQNFDAFWDQLLGGFWWILLPNMEPRCLQKPPGNRCQSRKAIFSKDLVLPSEKQ